MADFPRVRVTEEDLRPVLFKWVTPYGPLWLPGWLLDKIVDQIVELRQVGVLTRMQTAEVESLEKILREVEWKEGHGNSND